MTPSTLSQNASYSIHLYTDGACRGNPGPGGWGVLILYYALDDLDSLLAEKEYSGGITNTTNNRMELEAVIQGLACITEAGPIAIYTDSQYVQKGMSEWLASWKKKGWKTSTGQAVKNIDLWQKLDGLCQHRAFPIHWHWVRGHAGHALNERADRLATSAIP